jgi:hypothetical protein
MEPDNFEQQLQRQTIRKIPETWRDQVLSAAQNTYQSRPSPAVTPWWTALRALKARLPGLVWPSPKAWAGLVFVWLVIAVLNVTTSDRKGTVARISVDTREWLSSWKDQERLLSEVIRFQESPGAAPEPSRPAPGPRSEQRNDYPG